MFKWKIVIFVSEQYVSSKNTENLKYFSKGSSLAIILIEKKNNYISLKQLYSHSFIEQRTQDKQS